MGTKQTVIHNYYQILEIPADADFQTIKKAFRKLAHQYHPDKNLDNELKQKHYLLIQEAYQTLIDPKRRKNYDTELWLSSKQVSGKSINPQQLIAQLEDFSKKVIIKKEIHVLEDYHAAFLLEIMSDSNMAIFETKADENQTATLIDYIIFLSQDLPKRFRNVIFDRLLELFDKKVNGLRLRIEQIQTQKKSSDWYSQNMYWLIVGIALALCLIMYFYKRN